MDECDEEEEAVLLLCLGFSATATTMLMTCTWKYMDLETTGNGVTLRFTHCTEEGAGTGTLRTEHTHTRSYMNVRVHTPVVNEGRLHGKQQEGHDGVADGQLGGGPRHHVVAQLQASGPQEVVAERFPYLVCRAGRTAA